MGTFEDFEAELGIDMSDPLELLIKDLVDADDQLLEDLVAARIASGMSKAAVAAAIGRHPSVITNFEKLTADPHLSTVRRYAAAIGARITHLVEPMALQELTLAMPVVQTVEAVIDFAEAQAPMTLDFLQPPAGRPFTRVSSGEGALSIATEMHMAGA